MVKVKICGITNKEDAIFCSKFAHAIGCILEIKQSPRSLSIEKAKEVLSSALPLTSKIIVVADRKIDFLIEAVKEIEPDAVQLHGNESIDFVKELSGLFKENKTRTKIIKTLHIEEKEHAKKLSRIIGKAKEFADLCDAILLDTKTKALGGSGKKHNWQISAEIVKNLEKPIILAGGLNPENVREAISIVKPFAVDTSSGVEAETGRKHREKVIAFIRNMP